DDGERVARRRSERGALADGDVGSMAQIRGDEDSHGAGSCMSRAVDAKRRSDRAGLAVSRPHGRRAHVAREVVRSSVDVVEHRIRVNVVVVDDPERAQTLERSMAVRLSAATGVVPDVRAVAVPSADAVREAGRAALALRPEPIAPPELRPSTDRLADVLSQEW